MKAVVNHNPGNKSKLKIEEYPDPEYGEKELLVRVKATALNRADLFQRRGKYPPPPGASELLGLEMAGIVEATGRDVSKWEKGDRVFGLLPGGGYAQYCSIHEDMAMPIPNELDFEDAAAIPETFLTAYQALYWLGNLQDGENVLIHAGGSGVGTSAIQLARETGATIFTTAGAERKLQTCRELGATYTHNYREGPFEEYVNEHAGEEGIQLVIDFIGEPYWQQNLNVLATDGRLIFLAMMGGSRLKDERIGYILRKRLTIKGSTLRARDLNYKIELTRNFKKQSLPLFKQKNIHPIIDSVFEWEQVEEAHERMSNNENTGKIVLQIT